MRAGHCQTGPADPLSDSRSDLSLSARAVHGTISDDSWSDQSLLIRLHTNHLSDILLIVVLDFMNYEGPGHPRPRIEEIIGDDQ